MYKKTKQATPRNRGGVGEMLICIRQNKKLVSLKVMGTLMWLVTGYNSSRTTHERSIKNDNYFFNMQMLNVPYSMCVCTPSTGTNVHQGKLFDCVEICSYTLHTYYIITVTQLPSDECGPVEAIVSCDWLTRYCLLLCILLLHDSIKQYILGSKEQYSTGVLVLF